MDQGLHVTGYTAEQAYAIIDNMIEDCRASLVFEPETDEQVVYNDSILHQIDSLLETRRAIANNEYMAMTGGTQNG